ncbi:FAD-dependent oxidoreductase [Streptomyces sp. NPDC002521]
MSHRIVVLGAGHAGLLAAKRLARRLHRSGATVTLVNASDRFVERVRLHQLAAGQRLKAAEAVQRARPSAEADTTFRGWRWMRAGRLDPVTPGTRDGGHTLPSCEP